MCVSVRCISLSLDQAMLAWNIFDDFVMEESVSSV